MKLIINNIWHRHHEKTLVFTDQAIVSGSNFLIGILIVKVFGLYDLGVYSFAWMALMICSSLQQSFISIPMVNEYAARKGNEKKMYLQQLFILQLLVSLVLALCCYLAIIFLQQVAFFKTIHDQVFVLPLLVFFYTLYDLLRRVYLLRGNLIKVLIIDTLVNWSQVAFLSVNIYCHSWSLTETVYFFSLTYLLGFVPCLFEFFSFKQAGSSIPKLFALHWKTGNWLMASAVLQWFAGNLFIIAAGSLLGAEAAGVVRIAQSIIGVLNVLFIALELYIPVKASQFYDAGGKPELLKYISKVLFTGLAICGVFAFLTGLISSQLLTYLYGIHYAQYSAVITLFAVFYMLVFTGFPMRFALRAMNNTRAMFVAYVFAGIFGLLFSDLMITTWGIWGVLAGLAATQIIMQAWYIKELIYFNPNPSI